MLRFPTSIVPRDRSRRTTLIAVLGCLGVLAAAATATAVGTTSVITLSNGVNGAYGVAFSPDGARAYVTVADDDQVAVIDTATSTVTGYISSNGSCTSQSPRGVATTESRVFVASSGNDRVCVIDQASNAYIASFAIPDSPNVTQSKVIVIDQTAEVGYVLSNYLSTPSPHGPGRITRFDTTPPYNVGSTQVTISQAEGLALSVDGSELYVSTYDGKIEVIATATMTVTRTINLAGNLVSLAADPRGQYLIVSNNRGSGSTPASVDVVRIADGQLVGSVALGTNVDGDPFTQIAVSPDGRTAYVSQYWYNELWEVSVADPLNPQLASGTPMRLSPSVSRGAAGVAVAPDGARVYVTERFQDPATVMVITMETPGAPTGAQATAGVESATVEWTAPVSDGGAPVLAYTATAVEDPSKSCTTEATLPSAPATTCVITGLMPGTSYTIVVKARNGAGESAASAPTAAIIPRAAPAPTPPGPDPSPSLRVESTKVRSKGQSVVVRVRVSGAGRVGVVGSTASSGTSRVRVCRSSRSVTQAGVVSVTCRLNRTGRVMRTMAPLRIRLGITYVPSSGETRMATRVVRMAKTGGRPDPVTG